MRIGSLFSGIGGLDLGLERAGLGMVVLRCESNPFRREVLRCRWPDATSYDNVCSLTALDLESHHVDLLCGGFPCQDISLANHCGRGLDGERSGLWREFARLIRECRVRPSWVVVENVDHGWRRWVPTVRSDLARLGYWPVAVRVRADHCGLPHRRARCFVVAPAAHADAARLADAVRGAVPSAAGLSWTRPDGARVAWAQAWGDSMARAIVVRDAHGVPGRLERSRDEERVAALGDAVVPACAEVIGRLILSTLEARTP